MPGVAAGCLLVFILAIGYYITPALVGGPCFVADTRPLSQVNSLTQRPEAR